MYDTGSCLQGGYTDIRFPVPFSGHTDIAPCSKNDDTDPSSRQSVDMIVHSKTAASMAVDYCSAGALTRYVGWPVFRKGV